MSHQFSPSRSSSRYCSPTYPPTPVNHPPAARPPAAIGSPSYYLSPPPTYHPPPHPATASMIASHPVPPGWSQSIHTPQPSTFTHQPEHMAYQGYHFTEYMHGSQVLLPPGHFLPSSPATDALYLQQPPLLAWPLFPPGSYPPAPHPATYPSYHVLDANNLQPNSQYRTHQPEDSANQNYLAHRPSLQVPQGQASTQLPPGHYCNQGTLSGAHDLFLPNATFIDNSTTSENLMEKLLEHTIIGAEYDSSDRNPPPRCHPGTRLAILERCKGFINECHDEEKIRWVVGAAGVGKSAIMQMVAEETPADASVFFSVNGRRDGSKTFNTIAYQLATKHEPYHQFIAREFNRDPTLFRKALPAQFQKFIVNPFMYQRLFSPSDRFLVIIDGLDECDNSDTQRELLELISEFCHLYPTSPIVWFIASRPEPHITSFFDDERVAPMYTKEEIKIDSDEACRDVQRYLRDELNKIKNTYLNLKQKREWPSELEFTKIATAAGGLFAHAATVVRYIGDSHYRDPVSQLRDVLEVIDAGLKDDTLNKNPLALLYALYDRIISNIPAAVMINTRKLLLAHSPSGWPLASFRLQCNRLGLTEDAAYGAVCHLHAVLKIPSPHEADEQPLSYLHKSFEDFLFDSKRSTISSDIPNDTRLLMAQSSLRIVEQVKVPDNFDRQCFERGYLKAGYGFCNNVLLSWPHDERFQMYDPELRSKLYTVSMDDLCQKCHEGNKVFMTDIAYFDALTTRFATLGPRFPIDSVRDLVFDVYRSKLMDCGWLKEVPLRTLNYAAICGKIELRFTIPVGRDLKSSDPGNEFCYHKNHAKQDVDGLQQRQSWTTTFERYLGGPKDTVAVSDNPLSHRKVRKGAHYKAVGRVGNECPHCTQRLSRHFVKNSVQLVTVFVDSTEMCYVELLFVDPDDDMLEWRYRFFYSGQLSRKRV